MAADPVDPHREQAVRTTRADAPRPLAVATSSQPNQAARLVCLGTLAEGVAHEINNPLASLVAGVDALRRRISGGDVPLPSAGLEDVLRILDALEREAARVREVAKKLMVLAHPDSEPIDWFDLNSEIRDAAAQLQAAMKVQGVSMTLDLEPRLAPIRAREIGMRSVLSSLMMNGIQAMAEGGRLTVRSRDRQSVVVLEVEDTGAGIPSEHLGRIWEPFFTTKPAGRGAGLGLSTAWSVVAHHGGAMRAENVAPRGARFTVELPVRWLERDHA